MVVSELRGEKIDIIPWNTEPARFVAKALSPARVREVYIDDDTREATVVVPDDQLALAIGKDGLNARLAARLTGWKVDIQSDTEFAQAEAEAAYAGEDDTQEFSGRCSAMLSNGKRCPNAALPGSHYCGVPAHQALHGTEPPALAPDDDEGDDAVEVTPEIAEAQGLLDAIVEEAVAAGEISVDRGSRDRGRDRRGRSRAERPRGRRDRRLPSSRRTSLLARDRLAGENLCGLRSQGAAGGPRPFRRRGRSSDRSAEPSPAGASTRAVGSPASSEPWRRAASTGCCAAPCSSSRISRATTLTS